jgi:hypothetical protein
MKPNETAVLAGAAVSRRLQVFAVVVLAANGVPTISEKQWKIFIGAVGAHAVQSSIPLPLPMFANHLTLSIKEAGEHYWLAVTTKRPELIVDRPAWEEKFSVTCEKVNEQEWWFQFA